MKARETSAYQCRECRRFYREIGDAAFCCASDRYPLVKCWRCYDCGYLHASRLLADTCCQKETTHEQE